MEIEITDDIVLDSPPFLEVNTNLRPRQLPISESKIDLNDSQNKFLHDRKKLRISFEWHSFNVAYNFQIQDKVYNVDRPIATNMQIVILI